MDSPKTSIKIDRLALEGDGIGRLSDGRAMGQAAFVPYSLPEELIASRLLVQKKNHSRWLPVKLIEPSKKRIKPRCAYHFQPGGPNLWCGGCNWQHMAMESQQSAKRRLLVETLERLGGLNDPPVSSLLGSPLEWRYRNKVQVPFGVHSGKVIAGFYSPGTHHVVDFEDCLIQPKPSVEIVKFVKRYANDNRWPPYDEEKQRGWIRHLLIRTNEKGEALLALITSRETFFDKHKFVSEIRRNFPFVIGIHQNVQSARTNVILGRKWISLWGRERIEERLGGMNFSFSAGSFFQVNRGAAEILYSKAVEDLDIRSSSVVLDLYCGVGTMTLLAAKRARKAIGVESVPSAVGDARENARLNRISNVEFVEQSAEQFLRDGDIIRHPRTFLSGISSIRFPTTAFVPIRRLDINDGASRPSYRSSKRDGNDGSQILVILDPPRSGCSQDVLNGLLRFQPARIVYVSCHPATLARDIKILSPCYKPLSITPVDLFPQTSHIESVVRLERFSSS